MTRDMKVFLIIVAPFVGWAIVLNINTALWHQLRDAVDGAFPFLLWGVAILASLIVFCAVLSWTEKHLDRWAEARAAARKREIQDAVREVFAEHRRSERDWHESMESLRAMGTHDCGGGSTASGGHP